MTSRGPRNLIRPGARAFVWTATQPAQGNAVWKGNAALATSLMPYHESYFGAFVRDPDGNVEAICHTPAPQPQT